MDYWIQKPSGENKDFSLKEFLGELPKLCALSLVTSITLLSATPNNQDLNRVIEKKIVNCGVLTFTQKEISKSLLAELIDQQKSFTLTHLVNRDKVVEFLEKILDEKKQSYRIKKETEDVFDGVGIGDLFFGGGVLSVLGEVAGATKAYLKDIFSSDTKWLIVKSPDSRILDVLSVENLKNMSKEK